MSLSKKTSHRLKYEAIGAADDTVKSNDIKQPNTTNLSAIVAKHFYYFICLNVIKIIYFILFQVLPFYI